MHLLKKIQSHFVHHAVSIIILCVFHAAWASNYDHLLKEPGVLNVCSHDGFRPISYGNGQGFEADILKAIARTWDVKIKFYPESFYDGSWRFPSRMYTKCDVAIGGYTPLQYRINEGVGFSIPTVAFKQSLLVRKKDYESGRITSYESFKNTSMKIGVVPGTSGEMFARVIAKEKNLLPDIFVGYPTELGLLAMLRNGEIDAIARGEIGNDYQVSLHKDLMTIARRDFKEKFAFALSRTNPELIKAMNAAILKVTHDNKIQYSDWLKNNNIFIEKLSNY